MFDIVALGELLIDFTDSGFSPNGMKLFERNAGGAPGTKMRLAGRTLTPMPPASGELTVELRHKSEMHIGAAIRSAA